MLQKITIEGINSKDYQGTDKYTGQPYTAKIVGVFDGQKWYSYFDRKGIARNWVKGDTMEFDVTTKTTQDGKLMYNISLPDKLVVLEEKLEKLRAYIKGVDALLTENFPGWKDEYMDKAPVSVPVNKEPINVDKVVEEVSSWGQEDKSKVTEEKNDAGSRDEGALW